VNPCRAAFNPQAAVINEGYGPARKQREKKQNQRRKAEEDHGST
jgi:hypothetical protein